MPKIAYVEQKFKPSSLAVIQQANTIIAEYLRAGLQLTLRQLYYQFVARGLLANTMKNYKRLGGIVNDGRLAGLIDWEAIEDRTRNIQRNSHWASPEEIIHGAARGYRINNWEGQDYQPEVWIEKEALAGVLEQPCTDLDVPFFACRGYTSQSEMWGAAQRLMGYAEEGRRPVIIHLGDHDPSGIDMTRDIFDRMITFFGYHGIDPPKVRRIALNRNQVDRYNPPPNPAKTTDSRFREYRKVHGVESWELDALEPRVLVSLIRETVLEFRDEEVYAARIERQENERQALKKTAARWNEVIKFLDDGSTG